MGLRNTGRTNIGPLTVNYSATGRPSSVSLGMGPVRFRVWSRQQTPGVSSIDLPGPWSYRPNSTTKNRR